MDKDIYVIVSEKGASDGGGIVFEQEYHNADLESVKKRIHCLRRYPHYGKLRIAKPVFVEEEERQIRENCQHKEYTTERTNQFTVFASCKKCNFEWVHG